MISDISDGFLNLYKYKYSKKNYKYIGCVFIYCYWYKVHITDKQLAELDSF